MSYSRPPRRRPRVDPAADPAPEPIPDPAPRLTEGNAAAASAAAFRQECAAGRVRPVFPRETTLPLSSIGEIQLLTVNNHQPLRETSAWLKDNASRRTALRTALSPTKIEKILAKCDMSEPMKNIIRFVVFSRPDLREELFNIMVPKARYSEEIMLDKFRALLARIDAAHARTCANLQTVALLRGLQIPSMPAAAAGYIQRYLSLPDPIPVWRGYLAHAMTWPLINEIAGFKTGEALKERTAAQGKRVMWFAEREFASAVNQISHEYASVPEHRATFRFPPAIRGLYSNWVKDRMVWHLEIDTAAAEAAVPCRLRSDAMNIPPLASMLHSIQKCALEKGGANPAFMHPALCVTISHAFAAKPDGSQAQYLSADPTLANTLGVERVRRIPEAVMDVAMDASIARYVTFAGVSPCFVNCLDHGQVPLTAPRDFPANPDLSEIIKSTANDAVLTADNAFSAAGFGTPWTTAIKERTLDRQTPLCCIVRETPGHSISQLLHDGCAGDSRLPLFGITRSLLYQAAHAFYNAHRAISLVHGSIGEQTVSVKPLPEYGNRAWLFRTERGWMNIPPEDHCGLLLRICDYSNAYGSVRTNQNIEAPYEKAASVGNVAINTGILFDGSAAIHDFGQFCWFLAHSIDSIAVDVMCAEATERVKREYGIVDVDTVNDAAAMFSVLTSVLRDGLPVSLAKRKTATVILAKIEARRDDAEWLRRKLKDWVKRWPSDIPRHAAFGRFVRDVEGATAQQLYAAAEAMLEMWPREMGSQSIPMLQHDLEKPERFHVTTRKQRGDKPLDFLEELTEEELRAFVINSRAATVELLITSAATGTKRKALAHLRQVDIANKKKPRVGKGEIDTLTVDQLTDRLLYMAKKDQVTTAKTDLTCTAEVADMSIKEMREYLTDYLQLRLRINEENTLPEIADSDLAEQIHLNTISDVEFSVARSTKEQLLTDAKWIVRSSKELRTVRLEAIKAHVRHKKDDAAFLATFVRHAYTVLGNGMVFRLFRTMNTATKSEKAYRMLFPSDETARSRDEAENRLNQLCEYAAGMLLHPTEYDAKLDAHLALRDKMRDTHWETLKARYAMYSNIPLLALSMCRNRPDAPTPEDSRELTCLVEAFCAFTEDAYYSDVALHHRKFEFTVDRPLLRMGYVAKPRGKNIPKDESDIDVTVALRDFVIAHAVNDVKHAFGSYKFDEKIRYPPHVSDIFLNSNTDAIAMSTRGTFMSSQQASVTIGGACEICGGKVLDKENFNLQFAPSWSDPSMTTARIIHVCESKICKKIAEGTIDIASPLGIALYPIVALPTRVEGSPRPVQAAAAAAALAPAPAQRAESPDDTNVGGDEGRQMAAGGPVIAAPPPRFVFQKPSREMLRAFRASALATRDVPTISYEIGGDDMKAIAVDLIAELDDGTVDAILNPVPAADEAFFQRVAINVVKDGGILAADRIVLAIRGKPNLRPAMERISRGSLFDANEIVGFLRRFAAFRTVLEGPPRFAEDLLDIVGPNATAVHAASDYVLSAEAAVPDSPASRVRRLCEDNHVAIARLQEMTVMNPGTFSRFLQTVVHKRAARQAAAQPGAPGAPDVPVQPGFIPPGGDDDEGPDAAPDVRQEPPQFGMQHPPDVPPGQLGAEENALMMSIARSGILAEDITDILSNPNEIREKLEAILGVRRDMLRLARVDRTALAVPNNRIAWALTEDMIKTLIEMVSSDRPDRAQLVLNEARRNVDNNFDAAAAIRVLIPYGLIDTTTDLFDMCDIIRSKIEKDGHYDPAHMDDVLMTTLFIPPDSMTAGDKRTLYTFRRYFSERDLETAYSRVVDETLQASMKNMFVSAVTPKPKIVKTEQKRVRSMDKAILNELTLLTDSQFLRAVRLLVPLPRAEVDTDHPNETYVFKRMKAMRIAFGTSDTGIYKKLIGHSDFDWHLNPSDAAVSASATPMGAEPIAAKILDRLPRLNEPVVLDSAHRSKIYALLLRFSDETIRRLTVVALCGSETNDTGKLSWFINDVLSDASTM